MESPIRRMSSDNISQGYMGTDFGDVMNPYQNSYQPQGMPFRQQPFQQQHTSLHQPQIISPSPQQFQPIHQHQISHQHQARQIHQPSPQHFQPVNQSYTYHPQAQFPQQPPVILVSIASERALIIKYNNRIIL